MKRLWIGLGGLLAAQGVLGEDTVTVPWAEFSGLYRERIEREVREDLGQEDAGSEYVLTCAEFDLRLDGDCLRGQAQFEGRAVTGEPFAPLLDGSVLVAGIGPVEGGAIVRREGRAGILAEAGGSFRAVLDILVPVSDDGEILSSVFTAPEALQQRLRLDLPDTVRVLEAPGLRDVSGTYHLAAGGRIALRLAREAAPGEIAAPELDGITRVVLDGNRWMCTTHYLPRRPLRSAFEIALPAGARLQATSLTPGQLRQSAPARCRVDLAASAAGAFTVAYTLDVSPGEDVVTFPLPVIAGNAGEDRYLLIEQPDDAQLAFDDGGQPSLPRRVRTPPRLRELAGGPERCLVLEEGEPVALRVTRYAAVATPAAVLETMRFHTSFEENGGALSVLEVEVPPSVGSRLYVERIAGASIWGLTVNGEKREVRANEEGAWVIPLEPAKVSRVELTFLAKVPALGLQGRIEAVLPRTGLPAHRLVVGLGLPERVELMSLEGPVTPMGEGELPAQPAPGGGSRYSFSAAHYDGSGMTISAYYKEPARDPAAQ